jgi:uncharacterized protein
MMSLNTAFRIVDNMLVDLKTGDSATLAFQGGEPTLAGLDFFDDLFSYATGKAKECGVKLEYALQTNGLLMDESWVSLLKEFPVLVGISLDGYRDLHDFCRKCAEGKDTYKRVLGTKSLFDKHKIPYNILATLTNQMARHPLKIWQFLLKEKIEYVQFTPCLDSLDEVSSSVYALQPERFYRFYSAMFPLWASEIHKGHYISVKLFDDIANFFGRGIPSVCGINGYCMIQYVCEGDGSVFPCDFYMLDKYKLGSLVDSKPFDLRDSAQEFMSCGKEYVTKEPCINCRYFRACNGGCKRMVGAMYISNGLCWYAKLLDEILTPLLKIAKRLSGGAI